MTYKNQLDKRANNKLNYIRKIDYTYRINKLKYEIKELENKVLKKKLELNHIIELKSIDKDNNYKVKRGKTKRYSLNYDKIHGIGGSQKEKEAGK